MHRIKMLYDGGNGLSFRLTILQMLFSSSPDYRSMRWQVIGMPIHLAVQPYYSCMIRSKRPE